MRKCICWIAAIMDAFRSGKRQQTAKPSPCSAEGSMITLNRVPPGGVVYNVLRETNRGVPMPFPALNHVALTVRDLDVSGPWYRSLIGADPLLDEHTDAGFRHLVWAFDNGTLFGVHQHDRGIEDGRFSEFRAGLDHVG